MVYETIDEFFNALITTLKTGAGYWSSLLLLVVMALCFLLAFWVRKQGNHDYHKRTMQTQPFISGNALSNPEDGHIGADNLFWGFTHALRHYYELAEAAHTGRVNDYAGWFVLVLAFLMIIIVGGA